MASTEWLGRRALAPNCCVVVPARDARVPVSWKILAAKSCHEHEPLLVTFERDKRDQHSIVADPGFVDPKNYDFHLKPDSPALAPGFMPFDYTQASVYGDAAWVRQANEVNYPPLEWPPDPPEGAE